MQRSLVEAGVEVEIELLLMIIDLVRLIDLKIFKEIQENNNSRFSQNSLLDKVAIPPKLRQFFQPGSLQGSPTSGLCSAEIALLFIIHLYCGTDGYGRQIFDFLTR